MKNGAHTRPQRMIVKVTPKRAQLPHTTAPSLKKKSFLRVFHWAKMDWVSL